MLKTSKGSSGFSSHKGNIAIEGAIAIVVIFAFVMVSMFGYKLMNDLELDIKADINSTEAVEAYDEVHDRYPAVFSGLIVLVLMGFWAFVLVAALMSNEHPVLFMFSFILLIFVIIVSMILGNFYEEFFQDSEFSGITGAFAIPHFIMTHMLEISLIIAVTALVVMFVRSNR